MARYLAAIFFEEGVDTSTAKTIKNARDITSYFQHKNSPSQSNLPQGHHTVHDGIDNDEPTKKKMQNTIHSWITPRQPQNK
eukprot:4479064-Ditylum_brightwellii.AAC.1